MVQDENTAFFLKGCSKKAIVLLLFINLQTADFFGTPFWIKSSCFHTLWLNKLCFSRISSSSYYYPPSVSEAVARVKGYLNKQPTNDNCSKDKKKFLKFFGFFLFFLKIKEINQNEER